MGEMGMGGGGGIETGQTGQMEMEMGENINGEK